MIVVWSLAYPALVDTVNLNTFMRYKTGLFFVRSVQVEYPSFGFAKKNHDCRRSHPTRS